MDRGIDGIHQYGNGSILDDSICIVDYGCAGGKNSLAAIDMIIGKIVNASSKSKSQSGSSGNDKKKSITVIYNDQPTNDWMVAIDTIINHKESYIHKQYSTPIHFQTHTPGVFCTVLNCFTSLISFIGLACSVMFLLYVSPFSIALASIA
jgi:hypothetical protein